MSNFRTRISDSEAIAVARDLYEDDDVSIDENPPISRADSGVWVGAWVWVENETPALTAAMTAETVS